MCTWGVEQGDLSGGAFLKSVQSTDVVHDARCLLWYTAVKLADVSHRLTVKRIRDWDEPSLPRTDI